MITFQLQNDSITEARLEIDYSPAHELFAKLYQHYDHHFLLESVEVSLFSGRFSLIGLNPSLKIVGKNESFSIQALNKRGESYLSALAPVVDDYADSTKLEGRTLEGEVAKETKQLEESQRSKMRNSAQVIRLIIDHFSMNKKTLMGLYGAFAYDFIRLFEDLQDQLEKNETPDYSLFLYDTFVLIDHIKESSSIIAYRADEDSCLEPIHDIEELLETSTSQSSNYEIKDAKFSIEQEAFEAMVEQAREYIRQGELFQVVFSNCLKAKFSGDPFELYLQYREKNPSPYLFYYEFGDEQIIGASPEMMVRCEEGKVHLRPIAGTVKRGEDQVDDHDQLITLLNDPKERSELDMLVDLGRNDLSRICKPGIEVSDYRFVEKYSRVMHTVAHLTGELKDHYTGFDALIACLNAGTLTGAPKVAAMRTIEKHEPERRGYYGGAIGQLSFSGDVDTAILIRTTHIKGEDLRYQSGAGIVYDSDPSREYQETLAKAQAFLETFQE
jgi:anthranilate/para-aminobenzoate synthase component I